MVQLGDSKKTVLLIPYLYSQVKVNIRDQLPKYLDGAVKLLTTPCIVIETEKIGQEVYGALQILKQFPIHKCSHLDKPQDASACILSMVKPVNPNRYIIATQDNVLRESLRRIPGVALLYLHGNAPTIEKPSERSIQYSEGKNLEKLELLDYQKEILTKMKTDAFGETSAGDETRRKRKRKGGPNPLSCKKPKKKKSNSSSTQGAPSTETDLKKKRKRIKLKIPKHVKEEMQKKKP